MWYWTSWPTQYPTGMALVIHITNIIRTVLYGSWGWQSNISYFSVSSRSAPIQLKDISMLGFCFWVFVTGAVCFECFYHLRNQNLEKYVALPVLKILIGEETNLALLCSDSTAGSCFSVALFLPCNKSAQILLVFNFWVKKKKTGSLFLLGGDFHFLSTVSKNFLFSGIAWAAPVTGRALSPRHDSQPPGHPAKADLSFMGVLGSAASRCWSGDDSKARGRRKRGTRILRRLRLNAGGEKNIGCPNWLGLSQRENRAWLCGKKHCGGRMWLTGEGGITGSSREQEPDGEAELGQWEMQLAAGRGSGSVGKVAAAAARWREDRQWQGWAGRVQTVLELPHQPRQDRHTAALSCLRFPGSLLESHPQGQ